MSEQPYIIEKRLVITRKYNPAYGDDRDCECGHPYHRHFDSYEDMEAVGCKYCGCGTFVERDPNKNVDRSHEECVDCILLECEPPRCGGHPQGPVSCERFICRE